MRVAKITVIVISKGLQVLLKQCLVNLRTALDKIDSCRNKKIVVVDNASDFPYRKKEFDKADFELIRLDKAHSFAAANNLAAAFCPADYYLLLNNDVLLNPNTITAMLTVFKQHSKTGICGTRMLFPDDTIQHCGVVFGPGATGPYHYLRKRPGHLVARNLREYQAVTGACLLTRKEVWNNLQGMNEGFPFGLEDIDFCLRARQQGWRICCNNETDSLHFESMTPGRIKLDVGSRKIFMKKWQGHYGIDG